MNTAHSPEDSAYSPEDSATYNQQALNSLARAIQLSQGHFSLLLAHCNYSSLRDQILQRLRQEHAIQMQIVDVPASTRTLYTLIKTEVGANQPEALMVVGLEKVNDVEDLLTRINYVRDEFKKSFAFPIILWIDDAIQRKLARLAPDFNNWGGVPTRFTPTAEHCQELLETGVQQALAGKLGQLGFEPETMQQDLEAKRIDLSPQLQAGLDLLLGWKFYQTNQIQQALMHYERSLKYWQQTEHPFHQGIVWSHIADAYQQQAEQQKNQADWEAAKTALQQTIACFETAQHLKGQAQSYHHLEQVLQNLSDWRALKTTAEQAVSLHAKTGTPELMAQDYAFLAEAALHQNQYEASIALCHQALSQMVTPSYTRGFCYFLLAQANLQQPNPSSAQIQLAIANLEKAKLDTEPEENPQADPTLHIEILNQLSRHYFAQGRYVDAFRLKLNRRSVEQQYRLRAFIGPVRLQPQRQVQSTVETGENLEEVAREIAVSGRQGDVDRLIAKLREKRCKLIVLHGPSGVGKSSIISAGLIPRLRREEVWTWEVTPVYIRAYSDWKQELGKALVITGDAGKELSFTTQRLIQLLQEKEQHDQLIVLIFDQFEEFFFVCTEPNVRREFWEFLRICMEGEVVENTKVILSLREDYLHYLLELERLIEAQVSVDRVTNDALKDILNRQNRYSLGNLARADAEKVIQSLTQATQSPWEAGLIQQLIQDLSEETGKIRPIELQVVGAQLQTEGIVSLKQYQQLGKNPKETLVQKYLEEVVQACGKPNEEVVRLVLYLLTDENEKRPPKTESDLKVQLKDKADRLDNILTILVDSGLVSLLQASPAKRYQLVHDYLAALIRRQAEPELLTKLEKTEKQLHQSEGQRQRWQKITLFAIGVSGLAIVGWVSAAYLGFQAFKQQANTEIQSLSLSADNLWRSNLQIEALTQALNTVQQVKDQEKQGKKIEPEMKLLASATLQHIMEQIREVNVTRLKDYPDRSQIRFSPDGETLAAFSDDKKVRLWNRNGELIGTLEGDQGFITAIQYSPDGQLLASASSRIEKAQTVRVWKRSGKTFNSIETFSEHGALVRVLQFSPDRQLLASASDDGTVKVLKLNGKPIATLQRHGALVRVLQFSPDGQLLASGSDDGAVKLWKRSGETFNLIETFSGHEGPIQALQFSPNGQLLASAGDDGAVKLWKLNGELITALQSPEGSVRALQFSPNGQLLASGSDNGVVKLWKLNGELITTLQSPEGPVQALQFSPDGQLLASASDNGTVTLWRVDQKNNKNVTAFEGNQNGDQESLSKKLVKLVLSPDGQRVASISSGGNGDTVRLWTQNGKPITTLQGTQRVVLAVQFSRDNQLLASAGLDGTIKLWDQSGKPPRTLLGQQGPVWDVQFSPDGKVLASAGSDGTIKLWRIPEGTLIASPQVHQGRVLAVQFSPDGKILASAGDDKTIKLWNRNGKLIQPPQGDQGHQGAVWDLQFSPDGKTLASASSDKTVKLWDSHGNLIATLPGHQGAVLGVQFSPDGRIVASNSTDKTIKLWQLNGDLITTLQGDQNSILDTKWLGQHDQKILLSVSSDNTSRLWNFDAELLRKEGCRWLDDYFSNHPESNHRAHDLSTKLCP